MGILNLTPDSFYAGSRFNGFEAVLAQSEMMLEAGASILDLGGQSTRPGAAPVSAEEELSRVLPALEALLKRFPDAVVSIDTFYASVARACVDSDNSPSPSAKSMGSSTGVRVVPSDTGTTS